MKGKTIQKALWFWLLILSGCIDPYTPPAITENMNLLVVDGFLDANNQTATVKLSRTTPIYEGGSQILETNALVYIVGESGESYPLIQTEAGVYTEQGLTLDSFEKYRLSIKIGNSEYTSAKISIKHTPLIDTVEWYPSPEGLNIYVSTHDDDNQTHYYQWVFTETWLYRSDYTSYMILSGDTVIDRTPEQYTNVCYKTQSSNKILIESTTRLNEDVVDRFLLHTIPRSEPQAAFKYSILVQQRAIDEAAYNYFQQVKKTNESLGGLFDPMPSQAFGNIQNVSDPSEPVIGYFAGGTVQEKRIFIDKDDLPSGYITYPWWATSCEIQTAPLNFVKQIYPNYQIIYLESGSLTNYLIAPIACTDCRLSGSRGVLTKPDFWQ